MSTAETLAEAAQLAVAAAREGLEDI
jgi:hypothetical protein